MTDTSEHGPIPLRAPDGRVFAYACPRCLEVRASASGGGVGDAGRAFRAEWSKEDATQCCLCKRCGAEVRWYQLCPACQVAAHEELERDPVEQARRARWDAAHARAVASFQHSPNPSAARVLARLMSDLSEEHWSAGWLTGTEDVLWAAVHDGARRWGLADIDADDLAQLRYLSEQCGGWIVYGETEKEFVPLSTWQAQYAARHADVQAASASDAPLA